MSIIDKLPLTSHDIAADRLEQLRGIFPEVFAEGKIDYDTLLRMLGKWVEPGKERFGLNWPGKADCMKVIQSPSVGTLLPMREESVNFDTSENLIIEGDNLEVLKLLQRSYYGKVKMIYIDPPYNTGNEFIYPDNFREGLDEYLRFSGQVDAEGYKLSSNTETEGRYHSKWLSMMYPRLFLARNLLKDDGVIFVSIDDNEVHNLRALMNEVFGEENFLCTFAWEKRYSPPPDTKVIGYLHESIVCYRRTDKFSRNLLPLTEDQKARYKNPDNDPRGPWKSADYTCRYTSEERPTLYYPIIQPKTKQEIWPKKTRVWAMSKAVHEQYERENKIWWGAARKKKEVTFNKEILLNPDFEALWQRISQRTHYRVEFSTEELIQKAAERLKSTPPFIPVRIETTKVLLGQSRAGIEVGEVLEEHENYVSTPIDLPDLLAYLQNETELTRHTLVEIIRRSGRAEDFKINPQQFITVTAKEITKALRELMLTGINYEKIDNDMWDMRLLDEEAGQEFKRYLFDPYMVKHLERTTHDFIDIDSNVERTFAAALDRESSPVKVFMKLPRWFKVDTPIGTYNPDWAILFEEDERVYMVRETKDKPDRDDLRDSERKKVDCGEKHFAAIGVDFRMVTNLTDALRPTG